MATRSTIAVQHKDGSVSQVYCHWDGYLSNNGKILLEHYNKLGKVEKLMKYGDISSLRPNMVKKRGIVHNFDHRQEDVCTFYRRDRREKNVNARKFPNMDVFQIAGMAEEFDYLFKDGAWYVTGYSYNSETDESYDFKNVLLAEQLAKEEE